MMPNTVSLLFEYCLLGWLGVLALLITLRLLTGKISLRGILRSTTDQVDPERVQSLLVVLFVAGAYVVLAIQAWPTGNLPEMPNTLLALLTGSHGVYLSGKVARYHFARQASRRP